jgi:hypothetical protein
MYVEDLANAEWQLKRATRWVQNVGMKDDTTAILEDARSRAQNGLEFCAFPLRKAAADGGAKSLGFVDEW